MGLTPFLVGEIMHELQHYLKDGAGSQARAVLMHLQGRGNIESSWDDQFKNYRAKIQVARWENCREQGYVVMLNNRKHDQLNIAFFEHRNSDSIHAIMWMQNTINSPTIDTAKFNFGEQQVYKDKYDTSHSVSYHQYAEMGDWIFDRLTEWYEADTNK